MNTPASNAGKYLPRRAALAGVLLIFTSVYAWAWPGTLPVPRDVTVAVVGEEMRVNGIPLRAYEYFWNEEEQALLDFYSGLWQGGEADGQPAFIKMEIGEWQVISHIEGGFNFTVQYQEEGIRGFRVLLGISPLPKMLDKNRHGDTANNLKLLPGMSLISVVGANDAGIRSETYWIESRNSIEKTAQMLESYYMGEGFHVDRKNITRAGEGQPSSSLLKVEDNKQRLTFSINASDGATKVVAVWQGK